MAELVIIGSPYGERRKSPTSWVMVARPRKYFLPLLAREKRKEAVSSDFIIHHASSMTNRRFFSFFLIEFQMKLVMMWMATGFSSSSMSRTEKTTNLLFMSTFVG